VIRQCHVCGRGFVDVYRPEPHPIPLACATCRRGGKPLSRLVGGRTREEAERRDRAREAKR
jgi:hypothetical protein